ncbi:MAG: hypothetical protein NTW98_00610 [Candidatus Nomurabacteria bacterium]|nr:hypothetical protein [Candidatus Nomurabacteria bacterium]
MNQEELQQKIAEYYVKLPKKAQGVFASQKWLETLKKISERNTLNQEQIQTLGTETTLVLLSIISRDEYEKILTEELQLPKEKLENILEEINSLVLNPIINELSERYDKNIGILDEETLDQKIEKNNLIEENTDSRFTNLPENIKKIIEDSKYSQKIYILGKEKGLTIAQITNLDEMVTDTVLGKISPEVFKIRAMSIAGLDQNKLAILVSEINEKILKGIRQQILGLENKEKSELPSFVLRENKKEEIPVSPIAPLKEVVEIEAPKTANSITLTKLNETFKSGGAVTEYSLNNVSKQGSENNKNYSHNLQKVDPYRMPIE